MKDFLKTEIDERPVMIILGIIVFYLLITGFVLYLFFLHRLSLLWTVGVISGFTLLYLPRFFIIRQLMNKDEIKILDTCILVNGVGINFGDISDFRVEQGKPSVIFFMNNRMIVYNSARFRLRLLNGEIDFNVFGKEKIELLREFFNKLLCR